MTFTISTPTTSSQSGLPPSPRRPQRDADRHAPNGSPNLPQLNIFTVSPATVQGGSSFSWNRGTQRRAARRRKHSTSSSDTAVQPPASVAVPANSSTANVTIPTTAVTSPHTVTLSATFGTTTLTQQVTVAPPVQLTLNPTSVTGGTSVTGTITLAAVAPATGSHIVLTSSGTSFASTPGTVNIPAGQFTATFTITTYAVTAAHTATITATDGAVGSATATLTVNPQTAGQLQSVSISSTQVSGGATATGTVTLSGPGGVRRIGSSAEE